MLRLARVFERRGEGSLAFVGDGPLRPALEGRPGIVSSGPVDHDRVAAWIAAADVVCQPSLAEPFGLATLEGLGVWPLRRCDARRRAARVRPAGGGVLVDPLDDDALRAALDQAALLPRPNLEARRAAEGHDVRRQAERVEELSCFALLEIGKPELDQGPNCLPRAQLHEPPRGPPGSSPALSRARRPA